MKKLLNYILILSIIINLLGVLKLNASPLYPSPKEISDKAISYNTTISGKGAILYQTFSKDTYTFSQGDYLEYDVRINGNYGGVGGLDIYSTGNAVNCRDNGWFDQNGIAGLPNYSTEKDKMLEYAYKKWYTRRLAIPNAMIRQTGVNWMLVNQGSFANQSLSVQYDNIVIKNTQGQIVKTINTNEQNIVNENTHYNGNWTAIGIISEPRMPNATTALDLKAIISGSGGYLYNTFSKDTYTFQAGDYLDYDVWIDGNYGGVGGIDIYSTGNGTNCRDNGWFDQNRISGLPNSSTEKDAMLSKAYKKWYNRKLTIPNAMIGQTGANWMFVLQGSFIDQTFNVKYANVVVKNASGQIVKRIYTGYQNTVWENTLYSGNWTTASLTSFDAEVGPINFPAFKVITPKNGYSYSSSTFEVKWEKLEKALEYKVIFYEDKAFQSPCLSMTTKETSIVTSNLKSMTKYNVKVIAYTNLGAVLGSNQIIEFTTEQNNILSIGNIPWQQRTQIDNCDKQWESSEFDTQYYKEGFGAIKQVRDHLIQVNTSWTTPINTNIRESTAALSLWIYISDPNLINTSDGQIEIRSSILPDTDEYHWNIRDIMPNFQLGWNKLILPFRDAVKDGMPIISALKSMRIYFYVDGVFTMRLDDIAIIDLKDDLGTPSTKQNAMPDDGSELKLGNIVFDYGVGMTASVNGCSSVNADISSVNTRRFESCIGVKQGTANFKLLVNNKLVYESGNMTVSSGVKDISVNTEFTSSITLITENKGSDTVRSVWGNAWLKASNQVSAISPIKIISDCDYNNDGNWQTRDMNEDWYEKREGRSALINFCSFPIFELKINPFNTGLSKQNGGLTMWVYIDKPSELVGNGRIEISSSGTCDKDEYSWDLGDLGLEKGWNWVALPFIDAKVYGMPNADALNYFRMYQSAQQIIKMRIDSISIVDMSNASNYKQPNYIARMPIDHQLVLDACDSGCYWNNLAIDTFEKTEGVGSVRASGISPILEAHFNNNLKSDLSLEEGALTLWLYIDKPELTQYGDGRIDISSSGTCGFDELSWNLSTLSLNKGWNWLVLPFNSSRLTGKPDFNAINYFRAYQNSTQQLIMRLDHISLANMDKQETIAKPTVLKPWKDSAIQTSILIDNCETGVTWEWNRIDFTERKEGYGSVTATGKMPMFINKFKSTIKSNIDYHNEALAMWLYVDNVNKLKQDAEIQLCSTKEVNKSEFVWNLNDLALKSGWNKLLLRLDNAFLTGPVNANEFNMIRVYAQSVSDMTMKIDNVMLVDARQSDNTLFSTKTKVMPIKSSSVLMDSCDNNTGWKHVRVDRINFMDGTASLMYEGINPLFEKKFNPINTGISEQYGALEIWLLIDDVSKIADEGQIEISSSGKPNEYEYNWKLKGLDLKSGWNKLVLKIQNAEMLGNDITGGPDLTGINYFRCYNMTPQSVRMQIDSISFVNSKETLNSNTSFPSKVTSVISPINNLVLEKPYIPITNNEHFVRIIFYSTVGLLIFTILVCEAVIFIKLKRKKNI